MKLAEILEQANQQMGAGRIETDQLGVTRLLINDKYLIHLRSTQDLKFFHLYAKVGTLPKSIKKEEVCETLLEANLFGEETNNALFGLHRESGNIVLMKVFETENITVQKYLHDFQLFINYLAHWKEKLSDSSASADSYCSASETDILTLMSQRQQKVFFI